MNVDKIRNLTDVELDHQQRELADQLFRLKFQLKMGQTESLKKIRELKKDIARIKTVHAREADWPPATARQPAPEPRWPARAAKTAKKAAQQEGCNGEEVSHGRNDSNDSTQTAAGRRKTLIGEVVSTKMEKTIVVEVRRQKAHPFYKRVVARSKKFYAHDEQSTAHAGRLRADRRDASAVQAEALAVEGNRAARGAGGAGGRAAA